MYIYVVKINEFNYWLLPLLWMTTVQWQFCLRSLVARARSVTDRSMSFSPNAQSGHSESHSGNIWCHHFSSWWLSRAHVCNRSIFRESSILLYRPIHTPVSDLRNDPYVYGRETSQFVPFLELICFKHLSQSNISLTLRVKIKTSLWIKKL